MKILIIVNIISAIVLLASCTTPTAITRVAARPQPQASAAPVAPVATTAPPASGKLAEEMAVRQVQDATGLTLERVDSVASATTNAQKAQYGPPRGAFWRGQDSAVRLWVWARDGQALGAHMILGLGADRANAPRIQSVAHSVTSALNPQSVAWIDANLRLPGQGQKADYTVCEVGAAPDCDLDHSRIVAFNEGTEGSGTFVVDVVAQGAPPYVP